MDVIFENVCRITQPLLYEIVSATVSRKNRMFTYIGAGFFIILAVLCFFLKEIWLGAAILAFAAIYAYLTISMPKRTSKKVFETYIHNSNRDYLDIRVAFAELDITVETVSSGETRIYQYDDLKKMAETEHLYLLDMGNKTYIYVAKDGFTKGTCEEFVEFILRRADLEKGE